MFSSRTSWDLAPNRLALAVGRRRAAGSGLLDLTESNPTVVSLPYPADLLSPLSGPVSLTYAPDPRGTARAREAVAADYARRGCDVPSERLILTSSTSEAYGLLFKLLCDPGDVVLVPRPGYPLFEFLARLEMVEALPYELTWDGGWRLDVASLRAALSPRVRAVVVVHPGNPTGTFVKREEFHALDALAAERGVALVSDEVFADYAFGEDDARLPSLAGEGGHGLSFALGGLSKACGLPQLKLAWIAVSGPATLRQAALSRLEMIADTYLSVATPVQVALPQLFDRRRELWEPIAERTRRNLAHLREALLPDSPATLLEPEGGWYAVLHVPATLTEEERCIRLVEDEGVLVHPGFFFDFRTEAYLVLSLLPTPEIFGLGVQAILRSLML